MHAEGEVGLEQHKTTTKKSEPFLTNALKFNPLYFNMNEERAAPVLSVTCPAELGKD